MSKAFYPRLAAQNCIKNGKFYFPYLLTVVISSAAFYINLALAQTGSLPELQRYFYLSMFMTVGTFVLGLFFIIFLIYTNSFLMKRRGKELALYNILGMGKGNIGLVLSFETLYTWLIGAGGGILLGMLLQRLITMLVTRMLRIDVKYEFFISVYGIAVTAIFFGALLFVTLLLNLGRLHVQKPVELLRQGNVGEREPRTRWLLTILGLLSLGGGYAIALTTHNSIQAIGVYFVAVFLVIIGTYCLFSAVSVAVLKALRKNKGFFYRTGNFIGVSGMLHRMNRNAVGLANICILSTMVLVMISATLALFLGTEDAIATRYPGDLNAEVWYWTDRPFDTNRAEQKLTEALKEQGATVTGSLSYSTTDRPAAFDGSSFIIQDDVYNTGSDRILILLTAEDYNKLSGQKVSLAKDQLLISGRDSLVGDVRFVFRGESGEQVMRFSAAPTAEAFSLSSGDVYLGMVDYIILPDPDTLKEFENNCARALGEDEAFLSWYCEINTDGSDEEKAAWSAAVSDPDNCGLAGDDSIQWQLFRMDTQAENRQDFYTMNGGFFFLGVFLGFVFLMATVLIIYYKQISEGYEDRERFRIMRQVGLEKREIRRSINVQILIVFFAPLVVAGVHVAFDFNLVRLMLILFGLKNAALTAWCTLGTFLVFALIYALVYLLTARVYYRIVSGESRD
ncbi:MAG: FtsX-like permease family protein [Candidatus Limivicinus sp.]|nr:FtsX-like permease family protein [Candidatus Limivicinus sp.]